MFQIKSKLIIMFLLPRMFVLPAVSNSSGFMAATSMKFHTSFIPLAASAAKSDLATLRFVLSLYFYQSYISIILRIEFKITKGILCNVFSFSIGLLIVVVFYICPLISQQHIKRCLVLNVLYMVDYILGRYEFIS